MSDPVPVATPTTREVCLAFADATDRVGTTWSDRTSAFRRWLAQHDAEVARAAKVEALRDFAESHLYDGDRDVPLPGYTKAMQVAARITRDKESDRG